MKKRKKKLGSTSAVQETRDNTADRYMKELVVISVIIAKDE